VDIALVEGAVASVDDEKKIKKVRAHSKMLIAMGDCAVAERASMRNPFGPQPILDVPILRTRACSSRFRACCSKLLKWCVRFHEYVKWTCFCRLPALCDTFHTR